jgi:hypothetical protein
VPRQDGARPAATGRGPKGFLFGGEFSENSVSADRDQLQHLDLDYQALEYRGLLHPLVEGARHDRRLA